MSKTTIRTQATLTVVTEIDFEKLNFSLDQNPDWQDDVIKALRDLATNALCESFEGVQQTASFDNFKFEVSTDESN